MRKKVFAWAVFALALLCVGFVIAGSADHVTDINQAFTCLDNRVETSSLSLEDAVFAAMAKTPNPKINDTINQLKSGSEFCWPNSGCTVRTTAQVALAKIRMGENIGNITAWLKSRSGVTQQMTWYLQIIIDDNQPASCKINYDDSDKSVIIDEDMKLSGSPGNCLSITPSGYWMRIGNNCLDKTFSVQCDKGFKTNLLYEKETGGAIYISPQTHGAGAGSWTTERITAKCFQDGSSCNYEGSLWAAAALYANDEDIGEYAPYLRALAADNERYFPSAFLIAIYQGGEEHYAKIIGSQRIRPEGAYWQMTSTPYNKFYDTALAMLALGGADSPEIDNARTLNYLFINQDESGCWNGGSIRDTAFIIYAAHWPRSQGFCGDGACGTGETSQNCPGDCIICGDGVANGGEACDGTDLKDETCISKGFSGGDLACYANCTLNVEDCSGSVNQVCGDGMVTGSEVCDCGPDGVCTSPIELNNTECDSSDIGYAGGTLGCMPGCLTFNVSLCYSSGGPLPPGPENETTNQTNQSGGGPYNPGLLTDCELSGLYCVPSMWACQDVGGSYYPQSTHVCNSHLEYCCTAQVTEVTCTSLSGTVCPWDAPCTTATVESKDGPCCVVGTCEESNVGCASNDDCPAGRICNSVGMCVIESSSECNDDDDCGSGRECSAGRCVTASGGGSSLWIWIVVLLVLIVIVVLGIVYRDKLRVWWFQMRGKAKSSKVGQGGPPPGASMSRRPPPRFGMPGAMRPVMGGGPMMRPGMVRPAASPPAGAEPKSAKDKEAEETLKKLREMSK